MNAPLRIIPPAPAAEARLGLWWPEVSPDCSAAERERCECIWAATFENARLDYPELEDWDVYGAARSVLRRWFDGLGRMRPPLPLPPEPSDRVERSTYFRAGD